MNIQIILSILIVALLIFIAFLEFFEKRKFRIYFNIKNNKIKEKENSDENPAYTSDFYISQLPTSQKVIDSLSKERNFAYYQLGVIYKEKFKEYQLAVNKLEQLLKNNPEERLILPSMYNLYKLYEILDKNKALAMKARIIAEYPESRYAQILSNPQDQLADDNNSPKNY